MQLGRKVELFLNELNKLFHEHDSASEINSRV